MRASWLKKASFGIGFAALIVGATLLCLELGLRAAGFGHPTKFWRKYSAPDGKDWIRENWWVTAPFFAPELVRRPQPFRLPVEKPANEYRIFVLGSSAAMGDPEPSFSISRILDALLSEAYPEVKFEVVNAGITAINSHVVREVARDCAELAPDMFVVYEGNNEVIGPFGPATVFTANLRNPWIIDASIRFRALRLGQWATAVAQRASSETELKDWGGMEMFLKHQIAADDPRLDATAQLFERNLREIVRFGRAAGATVVLGTVLTNQRDFAPFQSRRSTSIPLRDERRFEEVFREAVNAAKSNSWDDAERLLREAIKIDPGYAESHFVLARLLLRRGDAAEAKEAFQKALDLDVLRFRTDSRLNEVVKKVARDPVTGASLCDFVQAGEAESAQGIIGDELLYEHVHLTFRGAYVVAREIFWKVSSDLRTRGKIVAQQSEVQPLSLDKARQRLAFSTYEQAMITRELVARLQRPPFSKQSNNQDRLALLMQRDSRAVQLLSLPESGDAMKAIYEQAIAARPTDWVLKRNFGMAMAAMGKGDLAKPALLDALAVIPDDPDTLYGLFVAHRALREFPEAEKRLSELQKIAPRYLEAAKTLYETDHR